jgi:hypothetical protein
MEVSHLQVVLIVVGLHMVLPGLAILTAYIKYKKGRGL